VATTIPEPTSSHESEFPANWIFKEHGDLVAGTFVRFERGQTRDFGPRVICVLEVEGVERSLWLNETVLYGKFRDEIQERPERTLTPGERVVVEKLGKTEGEYAKGSYWDFAIRFPDRPALSVSELFGLGEEPQPPAPAEPVAAATNWSDPDVDDIPF
jgi:hypothetical protein